MRNELLPDGPIQHGRPHHHKRPHMDVDGVDGVDGVLLKDGNNSNNTGTSSNNKHNRKRSNKCPEMKYNKFQMYDLKDGTATTTSATTSSHCSTPMANHKLSTDNSNTNMISPETLVMGGAETLVSGGGSVSGDKSPVSFYQQQRIQQTPPPHQRQVHHTHHPQQQQEHLQQQHQQETHGHQHHQHHHQPSVENDVKDIRRYLRQLLGRIHQKEDRAKIALEWKIVALVLDRVFFFCYLIAIVVSLATIFPKTY